ncbi:hypothetical protein VNO77_08216 [Canavalia gladiata]|uniref:Uncharacterized protein n=1 Tax=Canavalia gladiata TaxID=3824 RepID=A0AAN9QW50_CANGL
MERPSVNQLVDIFPCQVRSVLDPDQAKDREPPNLHLGLSGGDHLSQPQALRSMPIVIDFSGTSRRTYQSTCIATWISSQPSAWDPYSGRCPINIGLGPFFGQAWTRMHGLPLGRGHHHGLGHVCVDYEERTSSPEPGYRSSQSSLLATFLTLLRRISSAGRVPSDSSSTIPGPGNTLHSRGRRSFSFVPLSSPGLSTVSCNFSAPAQGGIYDPSLARSLILDASAGDVRIQNREPLHHHRRRSVSPDYSLYFDSADYRVRLRFSIQLDNGDRHGKLAFDLVWTRRRAYLNRSETNLKFTPMLRMRRLVCGDFPETPRTRGSTFSSNFKESKVPSKDPKAKTSQSAPSFL